MPGLAAAHFQDALGRALDEDPGRAVAVLVVGGHEAVLRLEGNRVQSRPGAVGDVLAEADLAAQDQQRALGGVAHDAPLVGLLLEVGVVAEHAGADRQRQRGVVLGVDDPVVEPAVAQRFVAHPGDVEYVIGADHPLHGHFVAGEGAGLVGTDHRHRAQGFHRRQAPDDRVALGHALHAQGQGDGHDRRQAFGNRRSGQGHHHHEHVGGRITSPERAEDEGGGGGGQHGEGQPAAEMIHLAQQRRGQVLDAGEHLVDLAQLGRRAGGDDDARRLAEHHQRAGIGHAVAIAQRRVGRHRIGAFFHRQGFAGERGFLDAQFLHLHQAQVGRHSVAGDQQHAVARHQLGGVYLPAVAAAHHGGVRGQHGADGIQRGFGLAFLDEADDGVDHHGGEQHAGIDPVPEDGGDHRRAEHHVEQDIVELHQQPHQHATTLGRGEAVGTVLLDAPRRFAVRQPVRAALQLRFDFGGRQGVPVRARMFAGVGGRAIVHDRRLLEVHGVRCVRGRPIRLAPSSLPNHPSAGMI